METARILVVEDQKIIALEIKERIEEMGYEVVAMASTGRQAIDKATEHIPDLVLMDIKLEGTMDGIEAADTIKKLLDIPVIFLTAYADEKTLERAKITEPFGYILKPLDERELKSAIIIALHKNSIELKLKESEAKFRTMVNSLEGYFVITDSERNVIAYNLNAEELKKQTDSLKCYNILHGYSEPCPECGHDLVLKGATTRIEKHDKNNDKWFYEVTTPVVFNKTNTFYQHLVLDITDRKKNEENLINLAKEKEVMLREIHHRVKNNLQLMLSLVRLQNSKSENEIVKSNLKIIESRLNSMALVHEDLYTSDNLTKVQFKPYVERLINHLQRAIGVDPDRIKINQDIARVNLSIDLAIPIGIIINELVTNSLKHAFNVSQSGNINIIFSRNNNDFYLEVSDDGNGLPDEFNFDKPTGLGLQIVKSLCGQISCIPEIKNDKGTGFRLKVDALNYTHSN